MVLGTDHPWVEPELFVNLIEGMNISDQEKSLIFSGNASQLFGMA